MIVLGFLLEVQSEKGMECEGLQGNKEGPSHTERKNSEKLEEVENLEEGKTKKTWMRKMTFGMWIW